MAGLDNTPDRSWTCPTFEELDESRYQPLDGMRIRFDINREAVLARRG